MSHSRGDFPRPHPSSIDLEAFACGETTASVSGHLDDCAACAAFVERLRGALSAGPSRAKAEETVARAARREPGPHPACAESVARTSARRAWWGRTASVIAVPLAVAAALLLFLKSPGSPGLLPGPSSAPQPTSEPTTAQTTAPDTTFKGGIQVAVIRERAGEQVRFTGTVRVRPGDRLRVEVALDREQAILAAVLGDDASWLELMSEGVRQPGTHFSEKAARVDASPLRGTILVGSPDVVAQARQRLDATKVATIRVEWETAP